MAAPSAQHAPLDLASADYVDDLGDGLVRRWSTVDDTEALADLIGTVFRGDDDEATNPRSVAEARAMMRPGFPYMTPNDVAVVEDTTKQGRPLVCCTCFWRHRWSYAGIPFDVTRPEMVGTRPEYRERGLVRSLFEMIHARSAAEGHLVQAITGISYYYRQFGYEYVFDLEGFRTAYLSLIPPDGDRPRAGALRLATLEDVPRIIELYNRRRSQSLVWHEAPEQRWRFEIAAATAPGVTDEDAIHGVISARYWVILDAAGEVCGSARISARRYRRWIVVSEVALEPRPDMSELVTGLLRSLADLARQTPGVRPDVQPCSEIAFELGRSHPLYDLLGERAPRYDPPYAWYIRVPDIRAFLRLIGRVLEQRLAASALAGYTGRPKFDLYRDGFQLQFEQGTLAAVEQWRAQAKDDSDAALQCPPLTFLQLLMSYRSVGELSDFFPDVAAVGENRLLVDTLFPRLHSTIEPMG